MWRHCYSPLSSKLIDEGSGCDDPNRSEAGITGEFQEVDVASYQEICFSVQRGREQGVVVWIAGSNDRLDLPVDPNGIDREQSEKERRIKAQEFVRSSRLGIREYPVIFAIHALCENQRETTGMPEVQDLERWT
jgi:hypothetical protein